MAVPTSLRICASRASRLIPAVSARRSSSSSAMPEAASSSRSSMSASISFSRPRARRMRRSIQEASPGREAMGRPACSPSRSSSSRERGLPRRRFSRSRRRSSGLMFSVISARASMRRWASSPPISARASRVGGAPIPKKRGNRRSKVSWSRFSLTRVRRSPLLKRSRSETPRMDEARNESSLSASETRTPEARRAWTNSTIRLSTD